jgi:hypothetical protein
MVSESREIAIYDNKVAREPEEAEQRLVDHIMREFNQLVVYRNAGFAGQWEEVADLILPTSRNTFFYGSYNTPGEKKTQLQVDATGMMALHRFAAICDSLLTPRNMIWHQLAADDPYVMKDRETRLWFEQATHTMFNERYAATANFSSQNQNNFQSLGAFGNACMFIDKYYGPGGGLRYKACPMGECFWGEDHQGTINRMNRWFKMTAWQAEERWPGQLPAQLQNAIKANNPMLFDFIHSVVPRTDYDPNAPDARRLPFRSAYLCVVGKCIMWNPDTEDMEQGYRSFPFAPARYDQAPNESYGRGPAMLVLPALKTLNAQKRSFLKQGHRASDPVLLSADDGIMNFSLRPGALNKGGMSPDGKPLVGILPTGNIGINEKMMAVEQGLINDAFLVSLFQILTESPQMTATEVIERTNEKGILLAPTVGRQQSEYLGPMIHRELDVLAAQGKLPPPPPRLMEAKGSYKVVYTSPLSKAQHAQEVAGTLRVLENIRELIAISGDPGPLDNFNLDKFTQDAARIGGTRESWLATDDQIKAKRKNREQAQQQKANMDSLPGKAAMLNAQSKIAKSNPGQMQQPQQGGPQ